MPGTPLFNPMTTLHFDIPASVERVVDVTLRIYNVQGQLVRTLLDGPKAPGRYTAEWDSRNDAGARVSSGVYFYELRAGGFVATGKMVLVK